MNLKNAILANLVGETIIYRGQFWRVTSIDLDAQFGQIKLAKDWNSDKGALSIRQLVDCRLYPSCEFIHAKYPRLLRALRWSCLLTSNEADDCIHGFLTTGSYYMGSEALSHIGGSLRALHHAITCRNRVRQDVAKRAAASKEMEIV